MPATLKKLSARHKEIARRLLVAETPQEIAEDLGMHKGSIIWISNQNLFKQYLGQLTYETDRRLTDAKGRLNVLEIFGDAEADAAQLCVDVMNDRVVPGDSSLNPDMRLKSAWDILDRQGYKAVEKKMTLSLSDLIIAAHKKAAPDKVN